MRVDSEDDNDNNNNNNTPNRTDRRRECTRYTLCERPAKPQNFSSIKQQTGQSRVSRFSTRKSKTQNPNQTIETETEREREGIPTYSTRLTIAAAVCVVSFGRWLYGVVSVDVNVDVVFDDASACITIARARQLHV